MGPNKIENEIREKLGKREIQPSAQAWDRLDAMLSVQESKVEKKAFPWFRIAATVVLFLGVSYFFYNSSEKNIKDDNSNIVFEDSKKTSTDGIKKEEIDVVKSSQSIINEKNSSIVYSETKNKNIKKVKESKVLKNSYSKEVLPQMSKENQVAYSDTKNETKNNEDKSELKIIVESKEAIAEAKMPIEKTKLKIDPSSLLDQVDGEIELTFRQKVMKTVKKGYKEAKEAVASRNQESLINH
ncbi:MULTISPECIES: hypothetical protein [Flavobacterium]|uniref:Anti-sigma factor n=1 Tax=Flavobacterium hankyongi TaxID=1176532 RepID=A0ABP8ZT09_9FLAO|nr:hypothetical protein [Flavobacterium sp. N1846]